MSESGQSRRIAIGADHGGYELKEHLARWLRGRLYEVEDCGTFNAQPADYPVIAAEVARRVASGDCPRGIIIDGAGIGSSMTANKFPGVRAALCYDLSSARNSREHNDANILTLGARLIGTGLAEQIVETFLGTECTEERHLKRVGMIGEIERGVAGGMTNDELRMTKGDCACKHAASETTPMDELKNLSPEDIDRIAARIAEMAGRGLIPGEPCACCGATCHGHCAEKNPTAMREFIAAGATRFGHGPGGGPVAADVAGSIDHTLLKPEATAKQVEQLCKEALQYGFATVCINPNHVKLAAGLLKGSSVGVCTVAGFPLGTHVPEIKALEARRAIRDGADEVDMVINIGALKGGEDELVYRDIRGVVEACEDGGAICKVIIECVLLTDEEKVRACLLSRRARADFVKTSTGFAAGGATVADVALMSEAVKGAHMGVKAAGGIRSYEDVKAMLAAGATRIGASAGVAIVKEAKGGGGAKAPVSSAKDKY